jgi:hypothetical protein
MSHLAISCDPRNKKLIRQANPAWAAPPERVLQTRRRGDRRVVGGEVDL